MTEQEFMERMKRANSKVKDGLFTPIVDMLPEDVALAIGANILTHKLFGLYCGIDSITFSMVFTIIWVLCYIHITED